MLRFLVAAHALFSDQHHYFIVMIVMMMEAIGLEMQKCLVTFDHSYEFLKCQRSLELG